MDATLYNDEPDSEPQSLGEILEELLAQYEARFTCVNVSIVETAATAA